MAIAFGRALIQPTEEGQGQRCNDLADGVQLARAE